MHKFFKVFLATILAIFSIPLGGISALAEDKGDTYENIADGEYELTAKLLKEGTDEESAAAGFMSDQVTLEVNDGHFLLTFYIPHNDGMIFNMFEVEGNRLNEPSTTNDDFMLYTFELNMLEKELSSKVSYEVPFLNMIHENVGMDIELVGLDELPVVEEEEQEPTPEQPEDSEKPESPEEDGKEESEGTESGEGSEEDSGDTEGEESEDETTEIEPLADGAYELSYTTEGADLSRYYEDKAIVIVDGDKQYLQLQGKSMRQFIEYLYIDGERMDISAATNEAGAYIAQFEMDEKVEENAPLAFDMVINAMGRIMAHGSKITLDLSSAKNVDSAELIEGVPSAENETFVTSTDSVSYEYDSGDVDLSSYYEDTINVLEKDGKQYIEFKGTGMANFIEALYVDGEKMAIEQNEDGSYIAQVEHEESLTEKFNFTMIINARGQIMSHSADIEVIIPEEGDETDSGKGEGDDEEKSLTPDKAYEIDYTILHEDGNAPSVADGFFKKPGTVLEYDGKTYFQMTVESAEMVKALSNKYGDYVLVDEKDGTKTMQLRVPNDLSDMKLDMHIVVPAGAIPGFPGYDEKHGAILTFDQDSKEEKNAENYTLAVTSDKDNKNAPFDGDAKDPKPTPDPTPKPTPTSEDPAEDPENKENGDDKEKSFKPEKAYEIMYQILHEDGNSVSVADGFFQKPGILLEYDGKTYFQMTVESAEMVKSLSNKYGDYILVSNNDDGTMTIQLRVDNDLSDMKLDMHIVVPAGAIPGFPGYDEKHGAILTFDKDSKKEISVDGLKIAASGDENNKNGPFSKDASPSKPSLGENGGDDNGKQAPDKSNNPKTGDTTGFLLYTLLLFASALPLIIQIRRRFGKA